MQKGLIGCSFIALFAFMGDVQGYDEGSLEAINAYFGFTAGLSNATGSEDTFIGWAPGRTSTRARETLFSEPTPAPS
jgi:hypothetical protein